MKTLVVVGDSHTAGSEIEAGPNNGYCYQKAWGRHLSDILGYNYTNLAKPGASNSFIVRTIMNWVLEHQNNINFLSSCKVVVMWSTFSRYEIIYPDKKVLKFFGPRFLTDKHETMYNEELNTLQKHKIIFYDHTQSLYENLQYVILLKMFFKSYGIDYIFINGITPWEPLDKLAPDTEFYQSYKNLLGTFDNLTSFLGFYELYDTYFHYLGKVKKFEFSEHSVNKHFGENAHIEWANLLYDKYFRKPI